MYILYILGNEFHLGILVIRLDLDSYVTRGEDMTTIEILYVTSFFCHCYCHGI